MRYGKLFQEMVTHPEKVLARVIFGRPGLATVVSKSNLIADPRNIATNSLAALLNIREIDVLSYIEEWAASTLPERFRSFVSDKILLGEGMQMLGSVAIYVIVRTLKPRTVVETGVAYGISSTCILEGMARNNKGELHSVDINMNSGAVIPQELRPRWSLVTGRSSDVLTPLLERLKEMDMFVHDSSHTYENMAWEFNVAWPYLSNGGILASDDIHANNAFIEFSRKVGRTPRLIYERRFLGLDGFSVNAVGAIRK